MHQKNPLIERVFLFHRDRLISFNAAIVPHRSGASVSASVLDADVAAQFHDA
jgi:hypothetical protein